jgi:hypothetical protein
MTWINQLAEQTKAVEELSTSSCQCLVYHPKASSNEWKRVYKDWTDTGKTSMQMSAQLFGYCPDQAAIVLS